MPSDTFSDLVIYLTLRLFFKDKFDGLKWKNWNIHEFCSTISELFSKQNVCLSCVINSVLYKISSAGVLCLKEVFCGYYF